MSYDNKALLSNWNASRLRCEVECINKDTEQLKGHTKGSSNNQ